MNHFPENAIAGPSTARSPRPHSLDAPIDPSAQSSHVPPPVFLPPPVQFPPSTSYLRCTQDLLGQFQLHAAYDKYVRPFAATHNAGSDTLNSASGVALDKGKGKEREVPATSPATVTTPAPDGLDGDDDDGGGKGDKKKKNNYKHLIKGVPGKHSMKKDDFLTTIVQVPPKQHIRVAHFDQRTQRDAFSVSLEGLKGWNPSALIQESAQAREDRKKRKEQRRLAKAQALGLQTGAAPAPGLPSSAPPVPSSSQSFTQPSTQPIPLSSPIPTNPTTTLPPARQPATTTPRPITATSTPRPGSTVPHTGGTQPIQHHQIPPNPRISTSTPVSNIPASGGAGGGGTHGYGSGSGPIGGGAQMRGVKRDREDIAGGGGQTMNGVGVSGVDGVNGVGHGTDMGGYGSGSGANPYVDSSTSVPKVIMAARAGMPGARPRPIKRQRMDMQGQALDVTAVQQQPTPQGV